MLYTSRMQFRVPQNITMEDRIVGSLTIIQFAILIIGGGIAFFALTSPLLVKLAPLNIILGGFFALLTGIMALLPFNGQPMYRFFRFIIAFALAPKTRVWHKTGKEVHLIRQSNHRVTAAKTTRAKQVSKEDIARLSLVLDSRGQAGMVPKLAQQPPAKPAKQ